MKKPTQNSTNAAPPAPKPAAAPYLPKVNAPATPDATPLAEVDSNAPRKRKLARRVDDEDSDVDKEPVRKSAKADEVPAVSEEPTTSTSRGRGRPRKSRSAVVVWTRHVVTVQIHATLPHSNQVNPTRQSAAIRRRRRRSRQHPPHLTRSTTRRLSQALLTIPGPGLPRKVWTLPGPPPPSAIVPATTQAAIDLDGDDEGPAVASTTRTNSFPPIGGGGDYRDARRRLPPSWNDALGEEMLRKAYLYIKHRLAKDIYTKNLYPDAGEDPAESRSAIAMAALEAVGIKPNEMDDDDKQVYMMLYVLARKMEATARGKVADHLRTCAERRYHIPRENSLVANREDVLKELLAKDTKGAPRFLLGPNSMYTRAEFLECIIDMVKQINKFFDKAIVCNVTAAMLATTRLTLERHFADKDLDAKEDAAPWELYRKTVASFMDQNADFYMDVQNAIFTPPTLRGANTMGEALAAEQAALLASYKGKGKGK